MYLRSRLQGVQHLPAIVTPYPRRTISGRKLACGTSTRVSDIARDVYEFLYRIFRYALLFTLGMAIQAAEPADQRRTPSPSAGASPLTFGGQREEFLVGTNRAFVILPRTSAKNGAIPWIWYAPTFVRPGGLPSRSHSWIFERLLAHGFAIGGMDVGESYGNPAGRAAFTEFHRAVVQRFGLSANAALLLQSRGGFMLYNWAAEHPELVSCIGGIYPVCDQSSWPGLSRSSGAYGMTETELGVQLAEHNPIDRLAPLARARIPILHLHGDADTVVPLERNSAELSRRFHALGGEMELLVIRGVGHKVCPEFFEEQRLVDFFLRHGTASSVGTNVPAK